MKEKYLKLIYTLRRVNCFLPSEQEVKFLFPSLSLEDAIKSLAELGPEVIVVKEAVGFSVFPKRGSFLKHPFVFHNIYRSYGSW